MAADDGPLDLDAARRGRAGDDGRGDLEQAAAEGARSLEDIERDATRAQDEEDDGQFTLSAGQRATRGTVIPRNTPLQHAIKFGSKRVQGRELGLVRWGESVLYLTRGIAGPTREVPHYNADEDVTDGVIEQMIIPKRVVNADSDEAMEMMAGILEKRGWVCTRADAA